jgi:hypothetical protein
MLSKLFRRTVRFDVTLTASLATTPDIGYADFAGGMVHVPTGSSITSLTWYTSHDGTTYIAAQDSTGVAVTQTVAAAKSYPIPDALFGAGKLKCVANAGGAVYLTFKS